MLVMIINIDIMICALQALSIFIASRLGSLSVCVQVYMSEPKKMQAESKNIIHYTHINQNDIIYSS